MPDSQSRRASWWSDPLPAGWHADAEISGSDADALSLRRRGPRSARACSRQRRPRRARHEGHADERAAVPAERGLRLLQGRSSAWRILAVGARTGRRHVRPSRLLGRCRAGACADVRARWLRAAASVGAPFRLAAAPAFRLAACSRLRLAAACSRARFAAALALRRGLLALALRGSLSRAALGFACSALALGGGLLALALRRRFPFVRFAAASPLTLGGGLLTLALRRLLCLLAPLSLLRRLALRRFAALPRWPRPRRVLPRGRLGTTSVGASAEPRFCAALHGTTAAASAL